MSLFQKHASFILERKCPAGCEEQLFHIVFYTQKAVVFVSAQQPGIFTPYTAVSNIYRLQNRQKKHQLQIAHLLGHWNKRIRRKTSHDLLSFEKEALDFKLKLTESPFLYFPLPFKLAFKANME